MGLSGCIEVLAKLRYESPRERKVKKILFGVLAMLLTTAAGYAADRTSQQPAQGSPLLLIIKSDKKVYEPGEVITIESAFLNISEKKIKPTDYMDSSDPSPSLFFKNDRGEECELIHRETLDEAMPLQLLPDQAAILWSYPVSPLETGKFKLGRYEFRFKKGGTYLCAGKQEVYLEAYGLTSNTVTIEVKETRQSLEQVKSMRPADRQPAQTNAARSAGTEKGLGDER